MRPADLDTPLMWISDQRVMTLHSPGVPSAGCARKGCTTHTSDWREPRGSEGNRHDVRAETHTTIAEAAGGRTWRTGALVSGYVVCRQGVPESATPRVSKESLPWLRSQGLDALQTCFIADIDTPGHLPWTAETRAVFDALWASAPSLATCGLYLSPKGYRLLQPLATWLPVDEAEPRLLAWLHQLVAEGAWASALECKDWGHLMRVARCVYKGERRDPDVVDLSRLRAIEAPPPRALPARVARGGVLPRVIVRADAVGALPAVAADSPPEWHPVADAVGAAIRDTVIRDWRRCYLALAGALCSRGCPLEYVPAVVARAHLVDPAWSYLLDDRTALATTTVTRYATGQTVSGYATLRSDFPGVADALDYATRRTAAEARVIDQLTADAGEGVPLVGVAERLALHLAGVAATAEAVAVRAQIDAAPGVEVPAATAGVVITHAIREAYGVTCLAAPPGTGKTQAVLAHAATLPPIEGRAAPGSRMAISVPTHKLGKQIAAKLPGRSLRIYSPTSHTQPDGSLTCIYSDSATPLAAGGQSVSKELCDGRGRDPCPERARCPAYAGQEGAPDANLVVGVHGLASALSGYAGTSGTLVVDEPGDPLFTERVTLDQVDGAVRYLDQFVTAYAVALAPALDAWRRWFVAPGSVAEGLTYLRRAVEAYAHEVSPDLLESAGIEGTAAAVLDAAAGAIRPDARSKAPPIRWSALAVARVNASRAAELGAASRVLDLLWRGLTAVAPAEGLLRTAPYAAALDGEDDDRAAVVVGVNGQLTAALAHPGPVVILDADVALHVPALTKLLGWAPPVTALRVPDGAPIARTILAARASRSTWLPRGLPDWTAILPALRWAIAWLAEGGATRSVGLIAPQVIEAAIAHTLAPDDPAPRKTWKACRGTAASLDRARAHLAPILAGWQGRYVLGHYQALEGLDHMADCDATVTLMDPRPNLGVERVKAAYLGLDVEGRLDALAGAELGQAHGRLRTVHRTRPGRQLHVGTVAPSGWQGRAVDVRVLPVGRPARAEGAVGAAEVLAARTALGLTAEALAGLLGVSRKTVQRYESGEREVPHDVAAAVRVLCPATETDTHPPVGVSDRGFGPTICPSGDTNGTETPFRYSSSERGFGPTVSSPGDILPDDEPLPSPTRRTVAEEHDEGGWAWLRVDAQRWDS